jgi:predicted NAD/FAD-binding protein
MKRIAVVGSGISGLAAAYFLSRRYEVHLFEKESRLGGHTHTVVVEGAAGPVALDTGFLVHNDRTYPRLVRLFRELDVPTRVSDMSFAVSCRRTGLEYGSRGARGFFADPRTLVSRSHLRLLKEIFRFNRKASAFLRAPDADGTTLDEFLVAHRFSDSFCSRYLFPMASAIWSTSLDAIRGFPAVTLVRFLDNHGLLSVNGQPPWKVVQGGSHTYIPKLLAPLGGRVSTGTTIQAIARSEHAVTIVCVNRPPLRFDEVVLACHGDQVLPLLADPSDAEREVFAAFQTTTNCAWLHTDERVLPARREARASWNYLLDGPTTAPPTVTYHLNRLQSLDSREQYCVTLNPNGSVDGARVLKRMVYQHPLYTRDAIRAQARWADVSGVRRTHYCGAYWFYGFHEDGLRSALRVSEALGVTW